MTDETDETMCEAFDRIIRENPRFIAAPRTGRAFVITGGRPTPTVGDAAPASAGQAAPAAAHPKRTSGA